METGRIGVRGRTVTLHVEAVRTCDNARARIQHLAKTGRTVLDTQRKQRLVQRQTVLAVFKAFIILYSLCFLYID